RGRPQGLFREAPAAVPEVVGHPRRVESPGSGGRGPGTVDGGAAGTTRTERAVAAADRGRPRRRGAEGERARVHHAVPGSLPAAAKGVPTGRVRRGQPAMSE